VARRSGTRGGEYAYRNTLRIAMLYTTDCSKEFRDYEAGLVPAHRLLGAAFLPGLGGQVSICRWGQLPTRFRHPQVWKLWQALWCSLRQREFDCIIATTEASALPVLFLRRLRLVRVPVVVLSVAILADKYVRGRGAGLRRFLLRGANVITAYANSQVPLARSKLGLRLDQVRFLPFGVDNGFFAPLKGVPEWDIISVGTNEGKDFATLVSALVSGQGCLIVTDANNEAIARAAPTAGDLTVRQAVPIHELRRLYASARRCVIPLHEIDYSSGQTVLLENLAMGRPVVVSDVSCVRDYVNPGVAVIVPPGDLGAMRDALQEDVPDFVLAASEHTRRYFDAEQFSRALWRICLEVVGAKSTA
jgi:glycosyltransferase involved in cell wall biosynthesis